jgi:hypothetical protein
LLYYYALVVINWKLTTSNIIEIIDDNAPSVKILRKYIPHSLNSKIIEIINKLNNLPHNIDISWKIVARYVERDILKIYKWNNKIVISANTTENNNNIIETLKYYVTKEYLLPRIVMWCILVLSGFIVKEFYHTSYRYLYTILLFIPLLRIMLLCHIIEILAADILYIHNNGYQKWIELLNNTANNKLIFGLYTNNKSKIDFILWILMSAPLDLNTHKRKIIVDNIIAMENNYNTT